VPKNFKKNAFALAHPEVNDKSTHERVLSLCAQYVFDEENFPKFYGLHEKLAANDLKKHRSPQYFQCLATGAESALAASLEDFVKIAIACRDLYVTVSALCGWNVSEGEEF
jgi:hypothetical protein